MKKLLLLLLLPINAYCQSNDSAKIENINYQLLVLKNNLNTSREYMDLAGRSLKRYSNQMGAGYTCYGLGLLSAGAGAVWSISSANNGNPNKGATYVLAGGGVLAITGLIIQIIALDQLDDASEYLKNGGLSIPIR